jgi:hypothetical protein
MTLPDPVSLRKPRRLGLYGPFVLLLIAVIGWSCAWGWLRGEVERRMDAARAALGPSGYQVSWGSRTVDGYPFRLDVTLLDARLRAPSGWTLTAPILKAEAFAHAPDHWVAVAPGGLILVRRKGGAVAIGARVLRASLSEAGAHPPRFSLEGMGLTFTPAPGADPYVITSADEIHLHTRAGPKDEGAAYLELDQARARFSGLIGRIAEGRPVSLIADGVYSHAGALQGGDWATAVRAWRDAGGALMVRHIRVAAGQSVLDARAGSLAVDGEGRLSGALTADLRQAPRALGALARAGDLAPEAVGSAAAVLGARVRGPAATVTIDFQAGQTTLGPVAIGPAPRIY